MPLPTPTSLEVVFEDVLPTGNPPCTTTVNYGIAVKVTYRVLDERGNPISRTDMERQEEVTNRPLSMPQQPRKHPIARRPAADLQSPRCFFFQSSWVKAFMGVSFFFSKSPLSASNCLVSAVKSANTMSSSLPMASARSIWDCVGRPS